MPPPSARVLLLTYWADDDGVGAVRPARVAEAMRAAGIPVTVVTTRKKGRARRERTSDGCDVVRTRVIPHPLLEWTRRRPRRAVARPPTWETTPTHAEPAGTGDAHRYESFPSRVKRVVASIAYTPDRDLGWLPTTVGPARRAARHGRVDTVISTAPPFTTHLLALAVVRRGRHRWIADLRDPWVDNEASSIATSRVREAANRRLERIVVARADVVVCATEAMAQALRNRHPALPADRIRTIPNGWSRDELHAARQAVAVPEGGGWGDEDGDGHRVRPPRPFTVAHVGNITYHRTPVPLFHALARLRAKGIVTPGSVRILLLGTNEKVDGVAIAQHAEALGVGDLVEVRERTTRPEALREMVAADLLLLLANRQRSQVPLKTYEYLATRRPVLALTERDSATAALVRELGGTVVEPDDVDGIAAHLATALRSAAPGGRAPDLGRAAPNAPSGDPERYEWAVATGAFVDLVLGRNGTTPGQRGA